MDLMKVYDSVDWMFVINILKAFELPPVFISWIKECITTTFSINFNEELVGYFPRKTGLRQDDSFPHRCSF